MTGLEFIKPEKRPQGKGKVHTKYTNKYRSKLIKIALEAGNVSKVAREHDINVKTLHGWITRAKHTL